MALTASERLRRFLSQFSGEDRVLVVINADPDSIASAMAVRRLLWRRASVVTISCINTINRPDNITMVRLLGAKVIHIDTIDISRYTRFVIVDSQPSHHERFGQFEFDVVIDHHPTTDYKSKFFDVRPDYGATSSMLTEYIRAAGIRPSVKLATALFHAIKTDTNNFQRKTTIEDIRSFQFLFKYSSPHVISKIDKSEIRYSSLKYFRRALQGKRMRRGKLYAHLGNVADPDVCVQVADFFMKIETVKWSIVSGVVDKTLVIIFRNDGLRMNAGVLAKRSFGILGSAGGHRGTARAEIQTSNLKGIINFREEDKLLQWIISQIEKRAPAESLRPKKSADVVNTPIDENESRSSDKLATKEASKSKRSTGKDSAAKERKNGKDNEHTRSRAPNGLKTP